MELPWPPEIAGSTDAAEFSQSRSNLCLDLHGDPARARLAVFSDGNHHMALRDTLAAFLNRHPEAQDPFFLTAPPRVAVDWIERGALRVGNLVLSVAPHVVLGPPGVLDRLIAPGRLGAHRLFARSRGNTLLVPAGNPCGVHGIADLARPDVRVFLSNPRTETASYSIYAETLRRLARRAGATLGFLDRPDDPPARIVYGECVHHREAPQALADGRADVAVVFRHLALRYLRIFPGVFDTVELTSPEQDDPDNVCSPIHAGLWGDGGAWGGALVEFLGGTDAAAIYRHHGLHAGAPA